MALDLKELGLRAKLIRKEVLKINQIELAAKLDLTQNIISRLEIGEGVTIEIILKYLNYLYSQNLDAYKLFYLHFDVAGFEKSNYDLGKDKIAALLEENSKEQKEFFKEISLRLEAL